LEVTLLRAIQAVGQVTLGEVLDALKALRQGVELPPLGKQERRPMPVRPAAASKVGTARQAQRVDLQAAPSSSHSPVLPGLAHTVSSAPADRPEVTESKGSLQDTFGPPETGNELSHEAVAELDPTSSVAEGPEIDFQAGLPPEAAVEMAAEENLLAPAAQADSREAEASSDPPAETGKALDVEALWPSLVERVRRERSFISMWVESGVLEEICAGSAVFAFAEEQSLAADYIVKDGHREFLEGVLFDLTGLRLKVLTQLRESVQRRPVAQPPPAAKAPPKDPMDEFKNDPLIRKALEIFKARLEAVH
jgi:DNA polymerase-3 subunit gamma/tau